MDDLEPLVQQARDEFARALASAELEDAKARFLGKAGLVTQQLKSLAALGAEQKKARGAHTVTPQAQSGANNHQTLLWALRFRHLAGAHQT